MTEKRYACKWREFGEAGNVWDNENPDEFMNVQEVCDRLNEQHETIKKEEADYLHVIRAWKELDDEHKEYKEKVKDTLQEYLNTNVLKEYHQIVYDIAEELGIDLQ